MTSSSSKLSISEVGEHHASEPVPEDDAVSQMRDILFGQQIEAYEVRFNALEQSFLSKQEALLSNFEEQVTQLNERIEIERASRSADAKSLLAQIESKFNAIESSHAQTAQDLQASLDQTKIALEMKLNTSDKSAGSQRETLKNMFRELADKIDAI